MIVRVYSCVCVCHNQNHYSSCVCAFRMVLKIQYFDYSSASTNRTEKNSTSRIGRPNFGPFRCVNVAENRANIVCKALAVSVSESVSSFSMNYRFRRISLRQNSVFASRSVSHMQTIDAFKLTTDI